MAMGDMVVEHAVDHVAFEFGQAGDFAVANAGRRGTEIDGGDQILDAGPAFAKCFRRRGDAMAGQVGAASWMLDG